MLGVSLSPRLKCVASFIPKGSRVVDVGTDHARLPIWLIQNGITDCVTASDIRPGPLSRAEALIRRCGLTDRIKLVLCDGLELIDPEKTDTVVLAGLGGENIRDIIKKAPWVKENGRRLIMQPATAANLLREYLCDGGFEIKSERLALDSGRLYQIIVAEAGKMERLSNAGMYTGKYLKSDEHYKRFLESLIRRFEKACRGLKKSYSEVDPNRLTYYEQVTDELKEERKLLYGDSRADL